MARIFITGSSDGLGLAAAQLLIGQGHSVVLHARNEERAGQTMAKVPKAEKVLVADLADMEQTKNLAAQANAIGRFDAVIHNAAVYSTAPKQLFTVNSLAPYILTCLMERPQRLIYMSSGMHLQGSTDMNKLSVEKGCSYSDSKLHAVILAMDVARKWPDVYSNAVNPGWVPTKMGGKGAPDTFKQGIETQAWLAVSDDRAAKVSGHYFKHMEEGHYLPEANDPVLQDKFLTLCEKLTSINFPLPNS
jgi:NAD(P)-dependent dehydrogenase (short-subunit alcohol dehydrogenase family)